MDACFFDDEISGGEESDNLSVGVDDWGSVDIAHEHGAHGIHHIVFWGKGQDIAGHHVTNRKFSQHRSSGNRRY